MLSKSQEAWVQYCEDPLLNLIAVADSESLSCEHLFFLRRRQELIQHDSEGTDQKTADFHLSVYKELITNAVQERLKPSVAVIDSLEDSSECIARRHKPY